ncbi:hypothetical protein RFI_29181 [Reticulomyxa filosa]|uniref:Uncharacterized protein n=1 Tax=Reticulomyxa filosa TaxID=46433 RepID=X6M3K3_RETFI|nr:hypothetical protein RFI_29181 [Reticulomyxa filosa]|eukprot:ETO08211.1 hypothetical protein RFI_29181 [Reticulomyxa filosa]
MIRELTNPLRSSVDFSRDNSSLPSWAGRVHMLMTPTLEVIPSTNEDKKRRGSEPPEETNGQLQIIDRVGGDPEIVSFHFVDQDQKESGIRDQPMGAVPIEHHNSDVPILYHVADTIEMMTIPPNANVLQLQSQREQLQISQKQMEDTAQVLSSKTRPEQSKKHELLIGYDSNKQRGDIHLNHSDYSNNNNDNNNDNNNNNNSNNNNNDNNNNMNNSSNNNNSNKKDVTTMEWDETNVDLLLKKLVHLFDKVVEQLIDAMYCDSYKRFMNKREFDQWIQWVRDPFCPDADLPPCTQPF